MVKPDARKGDRECTPSENTNSKPIPRRERLTRNASVSKLPQPDMAPTNSWPSAVVQTVRLISVANGLGPAVAAAVNMIYDSQGKEHPIQSLHIEVHDELPEESEALEQKDPSRRKQKNQE